jgi:DNA polymerase I
VEVPPKTKPRVFLIDAYALIYRSYFAFINRPLTNAKGENTSAPFGMAQFLLDIRDKHEPDYMAVVFDAGNSHREKEYPAYKATREKMPDDLRASLPRIRELVAGFNDALVELDGYEADDVIGTLAIKARDAGLEAVIVSGDKDLYQLVGPGINLLNPGRGGPQGVAAEWVDESNVDHKFGIPASQVVDYLALIGDSSDNIPGAKGIGPKTAVKLLAEYGTVEAILEAAPTFTAKRARESLTEHADDVRLSKRLVTIMKDLDVPLDLEELKVRKEDSERLHKLFVELEFRRLMRRYAPDAPAAAAPEEADTAVVSSQASAVAPTLHLITELDQVSPLVAAIRACGSVAVQAETVFLDVHRADLVGLALSTEEGAAHYLSFGHASQGGLELALDDGAGPANLPPLDSPGMSELAAVLRDPEVKKTGADLKTVSLILERAGVELKGLSFDVEIASYVLAPSRRDHDVEALCHEFFGFQLPTYASVTGTGQKRIAFSEVLHEKARDYLAGRVEAAVRLSAQFAEDLQTSGLRSLFDDLEMPLVPVLAQMERWGIRIDGDFFDEMSVRLGGMLGSIKEAIFEVAGEEFNLNSTQQLRLLLFEKQGLPVIKRTKTGPSTDASVLEELAAQGAEVPRLMLDYREMEKLRNTYVDALPKLVNRRTGRIHTKFNQTVAATGRLSSSDPNLQNIPIRTDLGREVRKGFVPAQGYFFYGADYSQIELRILAHYSGDAPLVTAFQGGIDVHKQTASVIFDIPLDQVSSVQRGQAKTVNFATVYGQGAFSLAQQLDLSREEAQNFIDTYFERFSGVRTFLDDQVLKAKEQGFVETLMGRRRYIPELKAQNYNVRQFGERVAQNTPIQGTAADMIKKAMIDVAVALDDIDTGSRMLLQVHDELLFEVPRGEEDALAALVVQHMEAAMTLDVPLVAEGAVGESWYETKG